MAYPTIAINSSGSNTAASGAGPGTALTGTAAATHANTTVNITDAVDLSGVATDGSAALWVSSSSGLQWSRITAISGSSGNWTVTVSTAYANTESGRTWAIGGKRQTCAGSAQLFKDAVTSNTGWTIDIQTGETITVAIVCNIVANRATPLVIKSTTSTRPLITTATNSVDLFNISSAQYVMFQHLSFSSTAGTRGRGIGVPSATASNIWADDCVFDGFSTAIEGDNVTYFYIGYVILTRCEIKNCATAGTKLRSSLYAAQCYIHGNGDGFQWPNAAPIQTIEQPVVIVDCVISGNTNGVNYQYTGALSNCPLVLINNTISGNSGDGIKYSPSQLILVNVNNIYYNNTGTGLNLVGGAVADCTSYNNAYGSNGTNTSNVPIDLASITLTASPFNSATDFGLNSTAGGGAAAKGAAGLVTNASANTAGDVGAIPSGGGGAGGGGRLIGFGATLVGQA